MFFFTEQDPNFRIKGSRDPLGFQPIWQSLGRNVIKHLSTVSGNLKDFQVLSYAWFLFGKRDSKDFLSFFYKFEQACGFARGLYINGDAFNGVDFVRKNLNQEKYTFSVQNKHTLLSNQKSYGIYGKYNRPFNEMRIKEQEDFTQVMENALKTKVDYSVLLKKVELLMQNGETTFSKEDLLIFAELLKTITPKEQEFYKKHILQSNTEHLQYELFNLFQNNKELIEGKFDLFGFLNAIQSQQISEDLKSKLELIKQAEHILCPFTYLFKTLQSNSIWIASHVMSEPIFTSFPKKLNYVFNQPVLDELNGCLDDDYYNIAQVAINRNKQVSERRNNAPWIKEENKKFVVCYSDGANRITTFDKEVAFENNYFLPTYISMFKQIMQPNG